MAESKDLCSFIKTKTCSTISNFSVCDCSLKMKYIMLVWIALQAWEFLESYHSFNSHHLEIVEYPPQYNSTLCLQFFFQWFPAIYTCSRAWLGLLHVSRIVAPNKQSISKDRCQQSVQILSCQISFCKSPSENCYIHLWTAMLESPFWSNLRGLKAVWACSPGDSSIGSRWPNFLQKS